MHPIFGGRGRLGLYLLGWSPLAALIVVLLVWRGELSWGEAALVGLPLAYFFAYLCLSAWYLCRALPLQPGKSARHALEVLGGHLVAALASGALLALAGRGWLLLLSSISGLDRLDQRFPAVAPMLFALGVPLFLLAVAFHYLLLALAAGGAAERRALTQRVLAREAEWKALRAQLDPHFLFNGLNTIAALAASDPAGTRRMAILLAEFLRRSLQLGSREEIPLAEEAALASSYLAVERARFGERLEVIEALEPAALTQKVPPLLLQPLIENAVRHGIAQLLDGGVVRIEARLDEIGGGRLHLAVENPCDPDRPASTGHGVGLGNIRARLAGRYGEAASLRILATPGRFRVEIELPAGQALRLEGGSAQAASAPGAPGEDPGQ
ncbi:MAG TPA: histidine kinase [Thermoanaerobaculia bacterium]|nr:histidine kinase [Thermoanaerobaculia bacterium]